MENASTNNGVLNGTSLQSINEPIMHYIDEYRGFGKAGAVSIIEQCTTVINAKEVLSEKNFLRFLIEVELKENSSTFRKIKSIAEAAVRFKAVVHHLPNEWTTLYALSVLPPAQFADLVENQVIHPNMTAKILNEAIGKQGRKKEEFKITLDLSTLTIGKRARLIELIKSETAEFGVECKLTDVLKTSVEAYTAELSSLDDSKEERYEHAN